MKQIFGLNRIVCNFLVSKKGKWGKEKAKLFLSKLFAFSQSFSWKVFLGKEQPLLKLTC
jgi:hypothetical protein